MNPHYPLVAQRAAHQCEYCRAPEAVFNMAFEVEHIIPPLHGGHDDASNWALACRSCNLHKSDCIEALDAETGATVKLFNPRLDRWTEHFRVEAATGLIVGITADWPGDGGAIADEHTCSVGCAPAMDAFAIIPAERLR